MKVTRSVSTAAPTSPQPVRGGKVSLHVADILLPVSVCLWAIGLRRTNVTVPGSLGLLPHLPVIFYAGIALLVVSAAVELAHKRTSAWRMAAHAVALVTMLYGTAPVLYSEARYYWLYKYGAVVQYLIVNGHVNDAIDIFQNWPGFFALAAWFTKLAGLGSPLDYAKWAQLFYELAALPLLYLIYEAVHLTNRQRWVAILLYSASNWIAQDYLSPQATGTLLSLAVMAMVMRWLYVAAPERVPLWHLLRFRRARQPGATDEPARPPPRRSILVIIAILLMYFVLTFTHQLSPYLIVAQLGAIAVVGALRPRWLPLALAAIAVGYLLAHWSFISTHFRLLRGFGHFFHHLAPPSSKLGVGSPSERWIQRSAKALSLGIWALAAVGAWMRRRAGQEALPLLLLAVSPVLVLVVQGYGNEGILRVFLFSLPWSAALGACALLPRRAEDRTDVSQGNELPRTQARRRSAAQRRLRVLPVAIGLGVALILFFPAFFGDDQFNVISQPEVATIISFFTHAPSGTIYVALQGAPVHANNARYNQFPTRNVLRRILGNTPMGPEIADTLADRALHRHGREADKPAYIVIAPSMLAYSKAYQITPVGSFRILLDSLSHSAYWKLVRNRGGTVIYELVRATPPAPVNLPPGVKG